MLARLHSWNNIFNGKNVALPYEEQFPKCRKEKEKRLFAILNSPPPPTQRQTKL